MMSAISSTALFRGKCTSMAMPSPSFTPYSCIHQHRRTRATSPELLLLLHQQPFKCRSRAKKSEEMLFILLVKLKVNKLLSIKFASDQSTGEAPGASEGPSFSPESESRKRSFQSGKEEMDNSWKKRVAKIREPAGPESTVEATCDMGPLMEMSQLSAILSFNCPCYREQAQEKMKRNDLFFNWMLSKIKNSPNDYARFISRVFIDLDCIETLKRLFEVIAKSLSGPHTGDSIYNTVLYFPESPLSHQEILERFLREALQSKIFDIRSYLFDTVQASETLREMLISSIYADDRFVANLFHPRNLPEIIGVVNSAEFKCDCDRSQR